MSYLGKKLLAVSRAGSAEPLPTVIGQPWGGGYFAGRMQVDGQNYILVISPKASGQITAAYKSTGALGPLSSVWDGQANMDLAKADDLSLYPAQLACSQMTIGGFTDWVVPAHYQVDLLYRSFKSTNSANSTTVGANAAMYPPKGNYTATDPEVTPLELFLNNGSESLGVVSIQSSSRGTNTSQIVGVSMINGARTNYALTSSTPRVRAVRMVRVD